MEVLDGEAKGYENKEERRRPLNFLLSFARFMSKSGNEWDAQP